MPTRRFCFEGFLPSKNKERKKILKEISLETRTTILYEAPHRLIQLLQELGEFCGEERPLQVARELTKIHEQHVGPTIGAAIQHFSKNKPIGECTLVLGGAAEELAPQLSQVELIEEMKALIKNGFPASQAARVLAQKTGLRKRDLYNLLHEVNI